MAFVTRQETTWGDLREGERIVDKSGETWELLSDPQPIGSEVRVSISTDITQPTARVVVVVKPATDPVTVIREAGAVKVGPSVNPDIEPEPDPVLEAAKATVEDALGPTTEILPVIDTALELRSHLYLCHMTMIHEATTRAALLEHHRRSHLLESEGRGEKGYTPHEHKEEV